MAIRPYSVMMSTAVKVTTSASVPCRHRSVASTPTTMVATEGAPVERQTRLSAPLMGPGQARSRPLAKTTRANCKVMAREALKIAIIAPQVTIVLKVEPNAAPTTSVSGVLDDRKEASDAAPKTMAMNGTTSKTMPMVAAVTTAWPTCAADPAVSSEKLMALSYPLTEKSALTMAATIK